MNISTWLPQILQAAMDLLAWCIRKIGGPRRAPAKDLVTKEAVPGWVTAEELAFVLGTSAGTVHRWGRDNRFPRRQELDRSWRYNSEAAVAVWVAHGNRLA
jgi:predicted DNA-binding transcriptional regulator AlpA